MFNFTMQRNKQAFTLVEMIVASVICLIVAAIVLSIYISGSDLWEVARCQADLQARTRTALNSMVSELRNATRTSSQIPSPNLSIPAAPNNDSISFYLPFDNDSDGFITDANGEIEWGTGIQIDYQYDSSEKLLKRLENGVQTGTIARDVTDVQFIDASIDSDLFLNEVKVILSLNKITPRARDVWVTLSAIASLRN